MPFFFPGFLLGSAALANAAVGASLASQISSGSESTVVTENVLDFIGPPLSGMMYAQPFFGSMCETMPVISEPGLPAFTYWPTLGVDPSANCRSL